MRHKLRAHLYAFPVFFVTGLVYSLIAPTVMRTWKITGDEPHYLLAAHSIVHDGDLDLKNNYLDGDHREFYSSGFLDPHIKEQPDGTWLLSHDIGLPVILAPAYAWGGRFGVMQFFAWVGALLAAQMFLLGWEVSGSLWAGALGGACLAFSAPVALYVFQIYPEMIGGLIVLWAMRTIIGTAAWLRAGASPAPTITSEMEETPRRSAHAKRAAPFGIWVLGFGISILPWLSGRYIPLALFLLALFIWKNRASRARWIALSAMVAASLAFYLTFNFAHFGGPTPATTAAGNAVSAGFGNVAWGQIGRGLAGWLFDQQRGLFTFGPILIAAIFGLPHLWRLRKLDGALLVLPFVISWVLASVWGGFYIGWEISARFLIVGVPLLAAPIAAVFAGVRLNREDTKNAKFSFFSSLSLFLSALRAFAVNLAVWPLVAGLLTLSVLNAVLIFVEPKYAYKESPVKFYEEATHWQIRPYLPALGTRTIEMPRDGRAEWTATRAEGPHTLHQSEGLSELSIGWYGMYGQARLTNASRADAVALTFDIYSSESGIPLLHAEARPADADPATGLVNVAAKFYNPYYNKWDFPLYLDVQSTGAAEARLSWLLLEPDPVETYGRVGVWGGGVLVLTILFSGSPGVGRKTPPRISRTGNACFQ